MSLDLSEDPAGRAAAFATACTATWVFIRNLVMKPAIKSCHERIADMEKIIAEYREQRQIDRARISQLETVLLTHGGGELRAAMQAVMSEERIRHDGMKP